MDFTYRFSHSDDETDEVALSPIEKDALYRALREVAAEAIEMVKEFEDGATHTTVTSTVEAASIVAALEVIDAAERAEGGPLDGGLKNLRYRLRGRRF